MIGAELICSDEACAEAVETSVFSLALLDSLACDHCGCTLQTLAVWEVVDLHVRRPVSLPRAA